MMRRGRHNHTEQNTALLWQLLLKTSHKLYGITGIIAYLL